MKIISIEGLQKKYQTGLNALMNIDLEIHQGELFALLGPNGAGKTTLINIICGIVKPTSGKITISELDHINDYRKVRSLIGLVPQELTTDMFETVENTVRFSRNLFGKKDNPEFIEKVLKDLTLWDKRKSKIMNLSGGMKRRVMIAKALSHEPKILFLDEPTAGVDVSLRREMWEMVKELRKTGVTIILTTHYIEEAQEMADRIGVIKEGKLILVKEKDELLRELGQKQLILELENPLETIPESLSPLPLTLSHDHQKLIYTFKNQNEENLAEILKLFYQSGIGLKDLVTREKTLEDIFVQLVGAKHEPA